MVLESGKERLEELGEEVPPFILEKGSGCLQRSRCSWASAWLQARPRTVPLNPACLSLPFVVQGCPVLGSGVGQAGTGLPLPLGEGTTAEPSFPLLSWERRLLRRLEAAEGERERSLPCLGEAHAGWFGIADGHPQLPAGWGGAGEPAGHGGAGWALLRPGGHWGLQDKGHWFIVLGLLWLLRMGVLRPVGAGAQWDHTLRATWGSLREDTLGTLPRLHSPALSWLGACDPRSVLPARALACEGGLYASSPCADAPALCCARGPGAGLGRLCRGCSRCRWGLAISAVTPRRCGLCFLHSAR